MDAEQSARMLADAQSAGEPHGEAGQAHDGHDGCELWSQHVAAMHLFMALDSQWRMLATASSVVYCGLDYTAAREVASWMGLDVSPELLSQLREMEAEALPLRNARA